MTLAPHIACRRFLLCDPIPGEHILDVGCGNGDLIQEQLRIPGTVIGTEIEPQLVAAGRAQGLDVRFGFAENLPFEDNSFDRLLCSVVVPYTDERKAISEFARVLKPGGRIHATYHGLGYALHQIFRARQLRVRAYGFRTLLNTYSYWITGRRLPGKLGDAQCQSVRRLAAYYVSARLELQQELVVATFGNYPRFLCHDLRKPLDTRRQQRSA